MRRKAKSVNRQRERLERLQSSSSEAVAERMATAQEFRNRRARARYRPAPCTCGHDDKCRVRDFPGIELLDGADKGDVIPVVEGELFVRAPIPNGLADELQGGGWTPEPGPEEFSPGSLIRYRADEGAILSLLDALRASEEAEVRAAPNHIIPLNWSVKAKIGPENTCEELPKRPNAKLSGGRVIAIDTGLASTEDRARNDDWLEGAAGNLDPLDEVDRFGFLRPDDHLDIGAGHGTSVAYVVQRVAPDVEISVLRALGPDGVATEDTISDAICMAAKELAKTGGVINMSFGTQTYNDGPPMLIEETVNNLGLDPEGSRICLVAAGGNWGDERPSWPAALDGVIGVGGLQEDGSNATWSSRGKHVKFSAQAEGIVAAFVVGEETPSLVPSDPYDEHPDIWDGPNPNALWLGTSFAAPQVAARLAQLLGEGRGRTATQAVEQLAQEGESSKKFGVKLPHLWQ